MDKGHTLSDTPSGPRRENEPAAGACLVVAMECDRPLRAPSSHSLIGIDEVVIGRGAERAYDRYQRDGLRVLRIAIPSRRMSSLHFRLRRNRDGWLVEDADSKNGTFVDGLPVRSLSLADHAIIEAGRTIFLFRDGPAAQPSHEPERERDRDQRSQDLDLEITSPSGRPSALATLSPVLDREYRRLALVAQSRLPVLILGETGTGKEVTARALHELSKRSGPFVPVNCGALAESLLESELFGHKKGAFSGAAEDQPGLFRSAHGGTIFLDEIAELSPESQVALLRVLQEGEVRPVGSAEAIRIDVRVVAATLRDLPARVASGEFREDLYARLTGHSIELPPVRERREDIGLLCGALLRKLARSGQVRINLDDLHLDRAAARALFTYSWPLNVREIELTLTAALVLTESDMLELDSLPDRIRAVLDQPEPRPERRTQDQTLYHQLSTLLDQHHGNVSAVARTMGKAPMQIYRWLKRLGIDVATYRR